MPLNNPGAATLMTSGEYTGDGGVNKAIAHGMSKIPTIIFITSNVGSLGWIFTARAETNCLYPAATSSTILAVTVPDTTNFYVGNATSLLNSLNNIDSLYKWVALGY